jgi:flagellar capping protein FliD
VGSFLLGAVGALVIVWLRWVGVLPRFSSSVEIGIIEDEYKELSECMSAKVRETKSKMTDSKPEDEGSRITDPEVLHSNNLRDDIWRQRKSSFLVSAILYVILGGATALIFVGLEAQNILDPLVVGKLISAGALWSSFYSFIDVKKVDDINETIREKFDAQAVSKVEDVKKSFEVELKRQAADANRIIEDLGAKYNELATKYNRLRGIK